MCVVCALCASVLLHSRTRAHSHLAGIALTTPMPSHTGSRWPTALCMPRCTLSAFCVVPHCLLLRTALHCTVCAMLYCSCRQRAAGSESPATHCHTAWRLWAVGLLQCSVSLPWGSGQCNSCNARPPYLGAVGSGIPTRNCRIAWGRPAVGLLQCTTPLPGGSGLCNCRNALSYCLGAVGSATPAKNCLTVWGKWAMQLLQCIASLPGGSGQCKSCNAPPHRLGAVGRAIRAMH